MPRLPVLAIAQFFMSLSWVAYAIFLPALAARVGLEKSAVIWLLLVDQIVFMVADLLAGMFSDRAAAMTQRWGSVLGLLTGVSALALLAIPALVGASGAVPALVVPALVWVACSAALRAPLFALVGKHAGSDTGATVRWLLLGNGVALACAPYLASVLKGTAPLVSFAAISAGLVLCALLVAHSVADAGTPSVATPSVATPSVATPSVATPSVATPDGGATAYPNGMALLAAVAAAALAIQVHNALNAAPLYARGVAAAELHWWMPAFWAGFNLALLLPPPMQAWPPSRRIALFAAGVALALAACVVTALPAPQALLQALAGAAWAWLMCAAFACANAIGRPSRLGLMNGSVHAALAGAAILRLSLVAAGLPQALGSGIFVLPVVLAVVAALVLRIAPLARRERHSGR
jgi:hypothetical protein